MKGWKNRVELVVGKIGQGALDFTAKNLDRIGALASFVGGVGFSLAQSLDKPVDGAYYANGVVHGNIDVHVSLVNSDLGLHFTLPLNTEITQEGIGFNNLANYANPQWVQIISGGILGVGVTCRTIGGALKKYQQYMADKHEYPYLVFTDSKPSNVENFYNIAGSLSEAMALSMWGYSLMQTTIHYAVPFFYSVQKATYPTHGPVVNGTYYKGPTASGAQLVEVPLDDTVVPIWGDLSLLVQILLKGQVDYVYGAGVRIMPSKKRALPPAATIALAGTAAYVGDSIHTFFKRQEEKRRSFRLGLDESTLEGDLERGLMNNGSIQ